MPSDDTPSAHRPVATDHPVHLLVAARFSPYAFSDRPVRDEDLRSLLEAARWAPSSYNEQPWRYLIATKAQPNAFERMLGCLVEANQAWARHAPVLMIGLVARHFQRNGKENRAAEHDLGIASATLTIEATARGISVHQMIGIVPERVREAYQVPDEFEPLTGLAIGYPGELARLPAELQERDAGRRGRRPLSETVFDQRFGVAADIVT